MAMIVLLAVDDALAERIDRLYGRDADVIRWTPAADEQAASLVTRLNATRPEVLIAGSGIDVTVALDLASLLDRAQSGIGTIIAGSVPPSMVHAAMHAGVRDLLAIGASDEEISTAIDAALASAARARGTAASATAGADRPPGRLITVTAPKGGCGTTTVATNLALILAEQHPGQVALVDLDRQFGDVADVLRVRPTFSIADAATSSLQGTAARSFLSRCEAGVYALCAPAQPERAEEVTPDAVARILADLVEAFAYVIVDTAAGLDEVTLRAIEIADDAVLVVSNDASSVRGLRKELTTLDRLHLQVTFHVVVSRLDEHAHVHESDIEAACGRPVAVSIPNGRAVAKAHAHGQTVATAAPRSGVVKAIAALAERLTGEKAAPPRASHGITFRSGAAR